MTTATKDRVFLMDCLSCKRKHRMTMQTCTGCNSRSGEWVPQPVSGRVADACADMYECAGCEAYRDHLR